MSEIFNYSKMGEQRLLKLFLLFITLSQGFASLSNNAYADSLQLLVRKKRVIDRTPNANTRVSLSEIRYVVSVQENGVHACAGTILSARVILVPCSCIMNLSNYTIISGTIATSGGRRHTVTGILRHPRHAIHSHAFNIALLSIHEPIAFAGRNRNQPITIFESDHGELMPNTNVTVSGYGLAMEHRRRGVLCYNQREQVRQFMPHELRSIRLPTISTQDCAVRHNNDADITPEHVICTFHEHIYCGPGDIGSPLVYQLHLFGILSFEAEYGHVPRKPHVFVNVAAPALRNWIYQNINNIPEYVVPVVQQQAHQHNQNRGLHLGSQVHPVNDSRK